MATFLQYQVERNFEVKDMNAKKIVLVFIFTLTAVSLFGNKSLGDYINLLKKNNEKLKSLRYRYEATLKSAESEKFLPDPVFTTGIYLQSIETKVGAQKSRFGISQKIPFKGKLKLKMLSEKEKAKAILEIYKQTELNLIADFKKNYYTLSYLNEREEILKKHISLLKDLHSVIMSGYESGKGSYTAILRLESEIDSLKNLVKTVDELKWPVIAKLNEILNRNPEENIEVVPLEEFEIAHLEKSKEKLLIDSLFQTSPYLRSINFKMKAERLKRDLAKKNYYPNFTVGLDWINTAKTSQTGLKDNGKDGIIFKLGISIPLWRKKYRYQVEAANKRYLSEASEHVAAKNEKATALKKAFFEYSDGIRKLELYRDSIIPKTEEALKVLISAYESDNGNYLDIIDTERMLLQFELEVAKAKKDILSALSDIEKISGVKNLKNNTEAK